MNSYDYSVLELRSVIADVCAQIDMALGRPVLPPTTPTSVTYAVRDVISRLNAVEPSVFVLRTIESALVAYRSQDAQGVEDALVWVHQVMPEGVRAGSADIVGACIDDAVRSFGGSDGTFNAAGFSTAFARRTSTDVLDGNVVRGILSGRADVVFMPGGSHFKRVTP